MSSDPNNNTMHAELLPCPFCGGNASTNTHADNCYFILHAQLKEVNADFSRLPDLMAAWNRRGNANGADMARSDITGAEVWTVIEAYMRARDAGHTPGTSNWAIAILLALRAMPPIDNTVLSMPDRAPSEDGYPYG